jgi:DNA-binding transcriptional LysR family regulator
MNLKKLEAFVSVLEKKSFSEAAVTLKSSQPAISLKIKSLEEELGFELLDRSHSGIQPTAAGVLVYQAATEIFHRWGRLEDDLHGLHDTLTGNLTIGASTIPGTYLVPTWIKKFRKLYPKVTITVEISDSKDILNKLQNQQVDIGIIGMQQHSSKIKFKPIASDSIVLITPYDFPYAETTELNYSLLRDLDLVLREEGSGTRKVMEEYLKLSGYKLTDFRPSISIGNTEGVIAAVEAGLGFSFVSKLAAAPAAKAKRINMIEPTIPYERTFHLTNLLEKVDRPIIKEFNDFLIKDGLSY